VFDSVKEQRDSYITKKFIRLYISKHTRSPRPCQVLPGITSSPHLKCSRKRDASDFFLSLAPLRSPQRTCVVSPGARRGWHSQNSGWGKGTASFYFVTVLCEEETLPASRQHTECPACWNASRHHLKKRLIQVKSCCGPCPLPNTLSWC